MGMTRSPAYQKGAPERESEDNKREISTRLKSDADGIPSSKKQAGAQQREQHNVWVEDEPKEINYREKYPYYAGVILERLKPDGFTELGPLWAIDAIFYPIRVPIEQFDPQAVEKPETESEDSPEDRVTTASYKRYLKAQEIIRSEATTPTT
jgi:hypothetical protein